MTERELIESTRKAIEEYSKLPAEVQWRHLIEMGTINEKGEVIMGLEEAKAIEEEEARRNGAPAVPSPNAAKPGA